MKLKSVAAAGFLAFLFGPLGMFYTSFAAVVVLSVTDILLVSSKSLGWFLGSYVAGILCNMWMAQEHNEKVEDRLSVVEYPKAAWSHDTLSDDQDNIDKAKS